MADPKIRRLADYKKPEFTTDLVDLNFDIYPDHTDVISKVTYKRTAEGAGATELVLNAENPNPKGSPDYVRKIAVNGVALAEGTGYTYDKENGEIRIPLDPSEQEAGVEIETYLEPKNNAAKAGLYQSGGVIVSQCESESFRNIVPSLDRPDVMAAYKVRVEAPQDMCPVLLSNGDQTGSGQLAGGRHWAAFEDPIKKPSYLFCTANGKLVPCELDFTTQDGRPVKLSTYLEEGHDPEEVRHAVNSLAAFLKWDEDTFGFLYKRNSYKTVGVDEFTAGAMENPGLNVFRSTFIRATPRIATDANYQIVTNVVGHEGSHDKTGDEVTVANWLNICLKEALTVVREQMFTAFTTSKEHQRIKAVQNLRKTQFPEDDGPLAHPVLPKEVMSIDNCYSMTIYEKGAEVIRMMGELMGEKKLIEGIKNYVNTYSGQAVTINEFIDSMEKTSGLDLSHQFRLWYDQSGRPAVKAQGQYDAASQTYTLTLEQKTRPTKDQPVKQPFVIPVRMGLVDADGNNMPLVLDTDTAATPESGAGERVLTLSRNKQTFVFKNVTQEPAFHSLLRGFSAIIDLDAGLSEDQLYKQLLTDPDGFNRWEAGQKLALMEMQRLYTAQEATGGMPAVSPRYLDTLRQITHDTKTDPAVLALALTMPDVKEFESTMKPVDPVAVIAVNKTLRETIARELYSDFDQLFARLQDNQPYHFDYASMGKRDLKRIAVGYMMVNAGPAELKAARAFYRQADNMTDKMIAVDGLNDHISPEREAVLDDFYNEFRDDPIVIQKWFSTQAASQSDGTIARLREISASPVFNWENPGHVQSLVGRSTGISAGIGLCNNYSQFHRPDGEGYRFVADAVIKEDGISPGTASGLIDPLCRWHNYAPAAARLMIEQLERIGAAENIHNDVKEKVLLSLPDAQTRAELGLPPLGGNDNLNQPENKPAVG